MADINLFTRLKRLFSTDVIIRNEGGNQLKVIDVNSIQNSGKYETNSLIDRYNRIYSSNSTSLYGAQLNVNYQYLRSQLYSDYDIMDTDAIIASALDIVADECTLKNEMNEVIQIRSSDEDVQKILYNLFYDILNIEFNMWSWVRQMCKYGDFFLKLEISEKFGVYNVLPYSAYHIERQEGYDKENPSAVRFKFNQGGFNGGTPVSSFNQAKESGLFFDNYEVSHFRLLTDVNYLPYGRSYIEPARKLFKQYTLMEDAMLIHRISRAPEKRIFYINVGAIPPNEVENFMKKTISTMKKTPYIDQQTGEYNLKYNMQNMLEDFYIPVRGADTSTKIETTKGLDYTGMEDVIYLREKLFAALKVPKAFMGYEKDLCISPETLIPLLDGRTITAQDIIDEFNAGKKNYVYSIDENSKNIVPGEIEWAGFTRMNTQIVKVWLDNEQFIQCTPDHLFMTREGDWKEAQNLTEGEALMPLYLQQSTNKSINGYTQVYHPSTGKYEYVHRMVSNHYNIKEPNKVIHHIDFNKLNNNPEHNRWKEKYSYKNHKVVRIEWISENIDTCDLTIKNYHNFGTAAGVIIHNSGKATLAAEDIRFARTIDRLQRIMLSELNKIALIHLYVQGYRGETLTNFELLLTTPSIIYDQERIALMKEKVSLAKEIMDAKLLPTDWIYHNVFHFSEDQFDEYRDLILQDAKRQFRLAQVVEEGNDPLETGKSYGTPHDLASLYGKGRTTSDPSNVPTGYGESVKLGRPVEKATNINTQDNVFGRDRLGRKDMKIDDQADLRSINESKITKLKNNQFINEIEKKLVFQFDKAKESLLDENQLR